MKQRLEEIEQRTEDYTKEQFGRLYATHAKTIESYLRSCMELHKSVPLRSLKGEIIGRVVNSFYELSPETQIEFEHKWQGCELPLTRTFIQLRLDKSTSFERSESRRLLIGSEVNLSQGLDSKTQVTKGLWQQLVSAPYMLSMVEQDRSVEEKEKEIVNEENVRRTKRWIVILGDSGSGKTSFARWLVRHLAETFLSNKQHSTDFASLRIPILIRIGEFAELWSKSSSLTLFDYIGKHTWMGKAIVDDQLISLDDLSCALQDYIKQGQALIILDGLDEIPVSDQRSKIINIVENFVGTYVQTPTGRSVFDNVHLSRDFDDSSQSGGNQLIITSRIVGYHVTPLVGQFAHYTIRPMDKNHVKDFIDYWFYHVHQQIIDMLNLSKDNQGKNHGEVLKQEFEKKENVDLLDMASSPCLLSFICSVAFGQTNGSPLPTQRIELYQDIVDSMLNSWSTKESTISISKLIRILSDIAIHIHQNLASGLIHEDNMKEICIQSINAFLNENLNNNEDLSEIGNQANEFVRICREDIRILTARGESLYGFLHLTLQEYFTCLKLTNIDQLQQEKLPIQESSSENKVHLVTQLLHRHTNDPRFQVPNKLALSRISSCWSLDDFDDFCREFIRLEDTAESLLPVGAFLLISCTNDLVHYPSNNVLFDALDHLIIAAGQYQWSLVCPFLFDRISIALRKFRNNIVSLWINNLLSRSPPPNIQTISALCYLLQGTPGEFENINWLDQSSCSILQSFSTLDNENNQFAIDRLNGKSLQKEIEQQFNEIFPNLPVLLHTAIFIRCLPLLQRQETIENCRKTLLQKLTDADQQDQQVIYEALAPYMQINSSFAAFQQRILNDLTKENYDDYNKTMSSSSSVLRKCFTIGPYENVLNESLSLSLLLSNMYLVQLASEVHGCIGPSNRLSQISNTDASTTDESTIIMKLFQLKSPILTLAQASTITDLLSSNLSSNRWKYSKKFWAVLNDALHRLNLVEFKACRLIECWMRWKESTELSLFAFHAALLLAQSDFCIRHFTKDIVYRETTDNILAYGYPEYVEVASLIAVRMPAAFVSCIKDCGYEDDFKRSLFYTSKQHDFSRRSASLIILSVFGELTVELCDIFIEALCHDPYMRNTCYKCLARINTIKDENAVRNLLFSYLKSKSMNTRYAAAKMLLYFSQSSLILYDQVRVALNELMSDPTSEEDLWLIEEQEDLTECLYYYVGPLKNVIYSLLVQHLTGNTSRTVQKNGLNDIDSDFLQSDRASCLASCLYEEKKEEENSEIEKPSKSSHVFDNEENSTLHHSSISHYRSENDETPWIHEKQEGDDHARPFKNEEGSIERVATNNDMKQKTENEGIESSIVGVGMCPSQPPSRLSISEKKKSTLCVII
ncbi:unnamed protein product [Rotaria sordida]|uniref:NACHT domain-containing protein n=1 Tax=Rotaria sordida TaxID=392033 RepID=A0A815IZ61_9BILA|nr:unnamed protein product [Rotaria sordida]CAF1369962.1 unnamed protein product [Rotaria sordida]